MRKSFAIFSLSFILCLCFPLGTYASESSTAVYKCNDENRVHSYQDRLCSPRKNQDVLQVKENSITTKLRKSEIEMLEHSRTRMLHDAELATNRDIARINAKAKTKKATIAADAKIKATKIKAENNLYRSYQYSYERPIIKTKNTLKILIVK
jgi:hypothetical protein